MRGTILSRVFGLLAVSGPAAPLPVVLIDAQSAEPIANREVHFLTQVMCVRGPCPPFAVGNGRTDGNGGVQIPESLRSRANRISAEGYADMPIPDSLQNRLDGNRIHLDPEHAEGTRLRRLNAATLQPIGNVEVVLSTDDACRAGACSASLYRGRANRLGNVYVPAKLLGTWQSDLNRWIVVQGFQAYPYPPGRHHPNVLDLLPARRDRVFTDDENETNRTTLLLTKR